MPMTEEEERFCLETCRNAFEQWVRSEERSEPDEWPEFFDQKSGVFVCAYAYPYRTLRSKGGFEVTDQCLAEAIVSAAILCAGGEACERIKPSELSKTIIEVSLLSAPEPITVINPGKYPAKIEPGTDGIIVEKGGRKGLMLPQESKGRGWTAEDMLMQACARTGLAPDEWKTGSCIVRRFRAESVSEKKPPY